VLQEAELFRRLGDSDSAEDELDAGIDHAREFLGRHKVPRARYLLGRLLRAREMPDEALVELDRALESEPDFAEARFERGLLLAARNELGASERATAIADLGAAVGARSVLRDIDLLFGMAELAKLRGEHQQAMELLKEVLAYDTMYVPARVALAKAARALGQSDLAVYYSASALNVQQGFGPIFQARERTRLPTSILGLEGALVDYSDAVRDTHDHAPALAWRGLSRLRRALRLEREGSLDEALDAALGSVDDHDITVKLHGNVAGALNNRAVCSMVVDRLQAKAGDTAAAAEARAKAGADAAAAIALAPQMTAAHFNAGLIALRQATVLRALGRAEAAAGQAEAAQQAFTTARLLAPDEWPHAAACAQRLADVATIVAALR
jgi:tetratricopeptide (TPR) repeat protein